MHQAVLIAVTGIAAFVLAGCGASTKEPTSRQVSVHVGALTVAVPRGLRRTEIRSHGQLVGALVTDYAVTPGSPTLREGAFPTNGVALLVGRGALRALPGLRVPQLHLPLALGELRGPQHHANGTAWNGVLAFHGSAYTISFWVGRTAPPHDRADLATALRSIRHTR